jgi:tRNA(Arg) A34 adenosine deaminase TadA
MGMPAGFDAQVTAQARRLSTVPLRQIEREVAAKRSLWFAKHLSASALQRLGGPIAPRVAFEALFFDYMELCEDDLPVLAESDAEIVWASRNPCPTLEACGRLGLDTRVVCRGAYEKSTQTFVSLVDPELRFLRDYQEIRPYADHCRERIVRVDFKKMMGLAIQAAKQSRRNGNKGYGAVLALGQRVVATASDTAVTEGDPSRHAELTAIRQAVQALGDSNLAGAILFSACEPCPMCSSLAVWANVSALVFGTSIDKTAAQGRTRILVPAVEIVARGPAMVEVIPGVLESECFELYR